MKKNNKNGAFTWAVVFAWVFGIVGVAGVMYMLFTSDDYNGMGGERFDSSYIAKTDANTTDSEKKDEGMVPKVADNTPKTPVKKPTETPVVIPPVKPIEKAPVVKVTPPVIKPTPPVVKPTPPVVKVIPPVVKPTPPVIKPTPPIVKPTPPVVKVVPSTVKPKAPPAVVIAKPSKPRPDKIMSDGELEQLVKNIEQKGDENGIYAKCVQLRSSSGTNNKGALQQIETYLRSKKYSIAGREVTSASVSGIKIAPCNGCLKVTVGSL